MVTIGIFPAAGALGGATLKSLVHSTTHDPKFVVLVSRNPDKLQDEQKLGVTCRKADFDDKDSFDEAFRGVDVLNLISYPTFEHEHRFEVSHITVYSTASV